MKDSTRVQWAEIRGPEAYRLIALFRATNPMLGGIQPEELHWELSWTERFVPVDMDLDPATRASVRAHSISDVTLSCAVSPDSVGSKVQMKTIPRILRHILFDGERNRTA